MLVLATEREREREKETAEPLVNQVFLLLRKEMPGTEFYFATTDSHATPTANARNFIS